jgi:drug/metabolite transporter (DMT)-like permease
VLLPRTIKLILAFSAVYLIWGSIYLAVKLANETLPPFLQTGFRYLIAGTVLYGYASMSKPTLPPVLTGVLPCWLDY